MAVLVATEAREFRYIVRSHSLLPRWGESKLPDYLARLSFVLAQAQSLPKSAGNAR